MHGLKLNPYKLVVTKGLIKTSFPLTGKAASTRRNICKNPEKWFQQAGMFFFFINWPTFNSLNGVH